jgi:hypothetical protein
MEVDIEPFTFYEPIKKFGEIVSNRFGNGDIAIQKSFKIKMTPLLNVDISKQYIQVFSNGKPTSLLTKNDQQSLLAESKLFGQYAVKIDTIAPRISANNFKESDSVVRTNTLIWKVMESQTEIYNYNILVDGEWQPLEFDLKSNRLIFIRNGSAKKSSIIEVLVSDNCGNVRSWKKKLYFE